MQGRLEWWQEGAEQLTTTIQHIIEFAKLIPGFLSLPQDDQIILLKGGAFELALIRAAQLYSLEHNAVIIDDCCVPGTMATGRMQTYSNHVYYCCSALAVVGRARGEGSHR